MPNRVCAITGASGYLGSRLANYLESHGWQVLRMGRSSKSLPFSLGEPIDPTELSQRSVHALIHGAYDFSALTWDEIERRNIRGTELLFQSAQAAGVESIILISTMSAYPGCRSLYGRAKLEIESIGSRFGAIPIRPGLIYGQTPGGMVGAMLRLLKVFPVLPLIGDGSSPLYLSHEDDLLELISRALQEDRFKRVGPVVAASEQKLSFKEILKAFGRQIGKRPHFIPLPWRLIWLALRSIEALGIRSRIKSDSVLGLVYSDPSPDFSGARQVGAAFRPLTSSGRPELLR